MAAALRLERLLPRAALLLPQPVLVPRPVLRARARLQAQVVLRLRFRRPARLPRRSLRLRLRARAPGPPLARAFARRCRAARTTPTVAAGARSQPHLERERALERGDRIERQEVVIEK